MSVFDSFGRLVLIGRDSNISDDRSDDGTDLSRGSFGVLDPFIGNVELPEGTYFAAVTSNARVPNELLVNPLVRLEPVNSVTRIAEDHILSSGGSTAAPPVVPFLLDSQSITPLSPDEVELFVIQDPTLGGALDEDDDIMNLRAVNPFNGLVIRDVDEFEDDDGPVELEDIATRLDGNTFGFRTIDDVPAELSDANVGIFQGINTSTWDGVSANQLLAGRDDQILTYIEDPLTTGRALLADVGIQFDALTFGIIDGQERLFAVGHRGDIDFNPQPSGPAYFENILYQFDPQTGIATSAPQVDRVGDARIQGCRNDNRRTWFPGHQSQQRSWWPHHRSGSYRRNSVRRFGYRWTVPSFRIR